MKPMKPKYSVHVSDEDVEDYDYAVNRIEDAIFIIEDIVGNVVVSDLKKALETLKETVVTPDPDELDGDSYDEHCRTESAPENYL